MPELPPLFIFQLFIACALGYLLGIFASTRKISRLELLCHKAEMETSLVTAAVLDSYKSSREFRDMLELQFEKGKSEGASTAMQTYKSSDDFSIVLSSQHAKGKLDGAAEELQKFHITYTPVLIDHETFFSHKVDGGYDMQLHYAGFPIGEPTRRITSHEEKSKDENVNRLISLVEKTIETAASLASKQQIPVTITKSPKREKRKGE